MTSAPVGDLLILFCVALFFFTSLVWRREDRETNRKLEREIENLRDRIAAMERQRSTAP
jgi:uncharacterized membrane protein